MKTKIVCILGLALTAAVLTAGCGNAKDTAGKTEDKGNQSAGTESGSKAGLGIVTDLSNSKAATAAEAGLVQTDATIAAVTVDAQGKIVTCTIDSVQAKVAFDGTGKITGDVSAAVPSKQELGEGYKMKAASSIGKEWNEQADAFAAYCIGKTAEEVTGIAVTEKGTAADADLAASCTVHIGVFQEAVAKAVENAR